MPSALLDQYGILCQNSLLKNMYLPNHILINKIFNNSLSPNNQGLFSFQGFSNPTLSNLLPITSVTNMVWVNWLPPCPTRTPGPLAPPCSCSGGSFLLPLAVFQICTAHNLPMPDIGFHFPRLLTYMNPLSPL